jgi:archaellum biogenesis protein FlaJ (TadC family)
MNKNHNIEHEHDSIDKTIIRLFNEKKPKTFQKLVYLTSIETSLKEQEIIDHIQKLQKQRKIILNYEPKDKQLNLREYLMKKDAYWYWLSQIIILVTFVTVFTVTNETNPFIYLRYFGGAITILWLPGYSILKILFPKKKQNGEKPKTLSPIERITLSFVISLAVIPIAGLILNYSPWGLRLTSIMFSILPITSIVLTIGLIIEQKNQTTDS